MTQIQTPDNRFLNNKFARVAIVKFYISIALGNFKTRCLLKKLSLFVVCFCAMVFYSNQSRAGAGISVGVGVPYVSQYGLNYSASPSWSFDLGYNALNLDLGTAGVDLSLIELMAKYHPFQGSFYIGIGAGSQSLSTSATDALTGAEATADVNSTAILGKLGWMWGRDNGGFWFGMDVTFVSPTSSEVEVETTGALSATDEEFQDVEDAGNQFGTTAYTNITFARLGYLF